MKKKSFYLDFDEQKDNECPSSLLIKLGGQLATFLSNKSDFIVRKSSKTKLKLFPRKNTILRQTRAMDLIVKSNKKEFERSSYTVEIAKKWNIKILIYEDTCQELKQLLKQWNTKAENTVQMTISRGCEIKIRRLRDRFMKVEDRSGVHRSCYKEFEKFPSINLELSSCPFDDPLVFHYNRPISRNAGEGRKVKFCECCNTTYTDLTTCLSSRQHQNFATDDNNYARIDAFIAENGLDVETFKAKMYKKVDLVEGLTPTHPVQNRGLFNSTNRSRAFKFIPTRLACLQVVL